MLNLLYPPQCYPPWPLEWSKRALWSKVALLVSTSVWVLSDSAGFIEGFAAPRWRKMSLPGHKQRRGCSALLLLSRLEIFVYAYMLALILVTMQFSAFFVWPLSHPPSPPSIYKLVVKLSLIQSPHFPPPLSLVARVPSQPVLSGPQQPQTPRHREVLVS